MVIQLDIVWLEATPSRLDFAHSSPQISWHELRLEMTQQRFIFYSILLASMFIILPPNWNVGWVVPPPLPPTPRIWPCQDHLSLLASIANQTGDAGWMLRWPRWVWGWRWCLLHTRDSRQSDWGAIMGVWSRNGRFPESGRYLQIVAKPEMNRFKDE